MRHDQKQHAGDSLVVLTLHSILERGHVIKPHPLQEERFSISPLFTRDFNLPI